MIKKQKATFIHWIAILSIAMASLVPAISQAVSVAKDGQHIAVEICTAGGQTISHSINLDEGPQQKSDQKSDEACSYCMVHSGLGLPIQTTLHVALNASRSLYAEVFYQSPTLLLSWVSLPSRAPPQS